MDTDISATPRAGIEAALAALGVEGARPADTGFDFGDPAGEAKAAMHRTVVVPLVHLATLHAGGADADAFLQGQLSNDVRRLTAGRSQLSSYNSPKGRALALLVLRRAEDGGAWLETETELAAETLRRLRMYILRSKVRLEDAAETQMALGVAGADAAAMLGRTGLRVPAEAWDCVAGEGLVLMRRTGAIPRFSLHGPASRLAAAWRQLATEARPAGTACWRLLDVLAGQPVVRAATRGLFVPQMLNLDALGAISFDKGCYPGQEIVARLHYLGTARRRMVRARIDGAAPPGAGAEIRTGAGEAAGEVVESATLPGGGTVILAVLRTDLQTGEPLHLGPERAPPLQAIEPLL